MSDNRPTTRTDALRPHFDAIWDDWLKGHDLEDEVAKHRVERARFHLLMRDCMQRIGGRPLTLLEIGSGTAIDSYILAEASHVQVVGVDISLPSLQVASRCGRYFARRIDLAAGDATRLPFADGCFDIVFSQGVVEHFRDPDLMMREQVRVLKRDGILVVNVPQKHTGYTRFKHARMAEGSWPWGWETEYSPGELRRLGRKHGLRPIATVGYDHWGSRRGTLYWRHAHSRLQRRNPWRDRLAFKVLETFYEGMWSWLEERWGHHFLINLTMAFVRDG